MRLFKRTGVQEIEWQWMSLEWEVSGSGRMKRMGPRYHYPRRPETRCTEVQVFHRRYSEREAKTMAKVEGVVKSL
jgi:hypothetical protein